MTGIEQYAQSAGGLPLPVDETSSPMTTNLWRLIWVAALMGIPLAIYVIDRSMSHTALITPISPLGLGAMRILGMLGGLLVAYLVLAQRDLGLFRKVVLGLIIPCGGFALGDGIAWRIADHWNFGQATMPFVTARYPIVSVKGGGKSHSYALGIDPYKTGEATQITIPYAQYRSLADSFQGQCVTVNERRAANGGIEISTLPANRAADGAAEVAPCDQAPLPWQ